MKEQIAKHHNRPHMEQQMRQVIQEEWDKITQERSIPLRRIIRQRVRGVIKARWRNQVIDLGESLKIWARA